MLAIRNSSPIIENNIIYHNQNNGVVVLGANSYPEVRYNIIIDNDASAMRADTSTLNHFVPEYNCGAENSSLDFLMPDSSFGRKITVNANLDSTDHHYNLTIPPLFIDVENGDFRLQSCSPCVDAGPEGVSGPGEDIGRIDFGVFPYSRTAAELRGVQTGTLNAGATYQMSCHVRVPPGETLTIPAGTIINIAGFFNIEIFGTLLIEGTAGNRVKIRSSSDEPGKGDWGVFVLYQDTLQTQPSQISYADISYFDYIEVRQAGVRFDYCTFEQSFHSGFRIVSGSDDGSTPVTFDHCHLDDLGLYAIQAEQSTVIIKNSLIENCIGEAVVLIGESPVEDETSKLTNNIIRNCAVTGLVCQNFASPQVINNVITLTGYGGIDCINNSSPLVLNNIISACGRPGIMVRNSSFPIIDYNDVWQNNTATDSTLNYQGTAAGPNDINADPQFTGDYNELGSGSPCIDAGHIGAEFNDSDGSQNNIGAYGGPNGGTMGP
jgi:parallel beta-helix repeat protein